MESLTLLLSWSFPEIIRCPASNGSSSIVTFVEKRSNSILQLNIITGERTLFSAPSEDALERICFDGLGNIYATAPRQSRIYILDADFKTKKVIDVSLAPNDGFLWIAGVSTGGFVLHFFEENRHGLAKYSENGDELWRWKSPMQFRPEPGFKREVGSTIILPQFAVHRHYYDFFSTAGAIRVYRINEDGELMGTEVLTDFEEESSRNGKHVGIELNGDIVIHDVSPIGETEQTLLIFRNLLIKHEWGQPLIAFAIPQDINELTCAQNDIIVGLKSRTLEDSVISTFAMPDWSQGTVQF